MYKTTDSSEDCDMTIGGVFTIPDLEEINEEQTEEESKEKQ